MQVVHLSYPLQLQNIEEQIVAIGDFDGVHKGHQEVIKTAEQKAKNLHLPVSVMTFHPHPREFLGQSNYAHYITPLRYKLDLFSQMGIDYTYIVEFNEAFAHLPPEHFIDEILLPLKVKGVVVGFDFRFGYKAAGTPDDLEKEGAGSFDVQVVHPFRMNANKVSSTLIREGLDQARVDQVRKLLGRPYAINGLVVHGEGRGRTIGFPTANLQVNDPFIIPTNGVYAVRVQIDGEKHDGIMNIGTKPTFSGEKVRTLEVHIFEFNQDLYGKSVLIQFISYIRPERKFSGPDELVEQIKTDIVEAKQSFVNS